MIFLILMCLNFLTAGAERISDVQVALHEVTVLSDSLLFYIVPDYPQGLLSVKVKREFDEDFNLTVSWSIDTKDDGVLETGYGVNFCTTDGEGNGKYVADIVRKSLALEEDGCPIHEQEHQSPPVYIKTQMDLGFMDGYDRFWLNIQTKKYQAVLLDQLFRVQPSVPKT